VMTWKKRNSTILPTCPMKNCNKSALLKKQSAEKKGKKSSLSHIKKINNREGEAIATGNFGDCFLFVCAHEEELSYENAPPAVAKLNCFATINEDMRYTKNRKGSLHKKGMFIRGNIFRR